MDFRLSETQIILAKSVTDLVTKHYDSNARWIFIEARPSKSDTFWNQLAELGLLGIEIDERFGGSGASFEDVAAVLQPFGEALVVHPFIASAVIGTSLLSAGGSEAQKAAHLPKLAGGETKLVLAHAERQARQHLAWVATTGVPAGDSVRLNGAKTAVLGGDEADHFIISARQANGTGDASGITLFLVPSSHPGLHVQRYTLYDGTGAADLTLTDVIIPANAIIGAAGAGLPLIEAAYDRGAAATCVEAIGAMSRLCDITVDYLKTREQFGQPIGKFQALQHRAVDMRIALELARSMALIAVDAIIRTEGAERARLVSAAKALVSHAARQIGQASVQLHGGLALTDEYSAGHYFKRLTAIERLFGDARYHTERFANS